jgi:hypothetical protein
MPDKPIREVVLYVDGPLTVRGRVLTTQRRGFRVDHPFYSDIDIRAQPSGLKATVTARAPDQVVAYKAANFFFGHMIDALTLAINVLGRGSPSFLRSLGWYRKGLTADDPLDKFLAFWNATEIVASDYYHYVPGIDIEQANQGSKNQVWACVEGQRLPVASRYGCLAW